MEDSLLEKVGRREALPSLPTSVTRVLAALDDGRSDAQIVADELASDVVLAAKVLAVANSVLYNPTGSAFASLGEAVARIGYDETRNLVLTTAVVSTFADLDCPFDYHAYWHHCVTTAIAAGTLAGRVPGIQGRLRPGENPYFVAGLMHDVGVLVLVASRGRRYARVLERAEREARPLFEVERDAMGFDHGDVGAAMLREWGLPEGVVVSAGFHHAPDGAPAELRSWAQLIHLADWISNHEVEGPRIEGELEPFHHDSWHDLGVGVDVIPTVIADFTQAAERSEALLAAAK